MIPSFRLTVVRITINLNEGGFRDTEKRRRVAIYEITRERIVKLDETTFGSAGIGERTDLQRLLRTQIEIVAPEVMVLAEEFRDWEDSKRRIDLLGLDKDANLVVIELKRTDDGGHMELQAIRYAAMVAAMTFEKAVEVHAAYLQERGQGGDARQAILDFLDWEEPDEDSFAQAVRIVLVSADFGKELTTAVLWLNEQGLDIRCVRLKPYSHDGRLFADVQQVIPLPEAEEYQVRIKEKAEHERTARVANSAKNERLRRFWGELLQLARVKNDLHTNVSPGTAWYLAASAGRAGFRFIYVLGHRVPRVELYIDTGDAEANKRLFDRLYASKAQIEERFGGALGWERLDGKQACRIRSDLESGSFSDESQWPATHSEMVDRMTRLARALRPAIEKLEK